MEWPVTIGIDLAMNVFQVHGMGAGAGLIRSGVARPDRDRSPCRRALPGVGAGGARA